MQSGRYKKNVDYYQDGSAARNLYTAAPVPDEFFEKDEALKEKERQQQRLAKRKRAQAAARSRAKAAKSKKLLLAWICVCVGVVVGISAIHLVSRNAVIQRTRTVNELQAELTELTKKNEALEAELNDSIDYDAIRDEAMNDYGMIYPEDGQIITYNADDEGYVKQFKDLN